VLHDDDLAVAIVDRILERGRILRFDRASTRTKHLPEHELSDQPNELDSGRRVSGAELAEFPKPTSSRFVSVHAGTIRRRSTAVRMAESASEVDSRIGFPSAAFASSIQ
jgi:hypothetical protein